MIAVVSAARPLNVPPMLAHLAGLEHTWYVPEEEVGEYQLAGAPRVVGTTGLCQARNVALREAWAAGDWCVQLSDDLVRLQFFDGTRKRPLDLPKALSLMNDALVATNAQLAGVAPTDNAYFYREPVSTRSFIVGDMVAMLPCDVFFDEQLTLKEDYDYCLQHLAMFGRVARVNGILATFKHRTNRGGAVRYRTPEVEQANIARLLAKWPGRLRPNPRRENEVLMVRQSPEDVAL